MNLKSIQKKDQAALTLVFENNYSAKLDLELLRRKCPCTECREARGELNHSKPIATSIKKKQGLKIIESSFEQQVSLNDLWTVGNYAIGLRWKDGHDSGIYSFDYLYEICKLKDQD